MKFVFILLLFSVAMVNGQINRSAKGKFDRLLAQNKGEPKFALAVKAQENEVPQTLNKILYLSSWSLLMVQRGIVDVNLWERNKNDLPPWIKSDEVNLGGAVITLLGVLYTGYNWKSCNLDEFMLTSLAGAIGGSVFWDGVFGAYRYHDWFYPFPDWYNGWGFKNKSQRILFDIGRLAAAVGLIYWSEKISSPKDVESNNDSGIQVAPILTPDRLSLNLNLNF
jgi:hypothetical protein